MKILVKMAWLNIWRNKRRAILLLAAMTAGLVGVLFSMGFVNGWLEAWRLRQLYPVNTLVHNAPGLVWV